MSFAEELAKLANLGILDHDGSLLGFRGNHIVNRQARGGGNSNCLWAGILIVADHTVADEADEPLDGSQICGKLVLGPRKLRTSDVQASDAESLSPLRGAFSD